MLKFLTNKLKNHTINDEPSLYVNPTNHHQYKRYHEPRLQRSATRSLSPRHCQNPAHKTILREPLHVPEPLKYGSLETKKPRAYVGATKSVQPRSTNHRPKIPRFGLLYLGSKSFGQHPYLLTIGEDGNVHNAKNSPTPLTVVCPKKFPKLITKDNEEHDSGTESDDEQQINLDELEEIVMENEILDRSSASTTSPGPTICSVPSPYFLDSALASDSDINNDHHSSEEELEVINSSLKAPVQSRNASRSGNSSVNLRSASVNALPEKRKWSEINLTNLGSVGKLNRLCLTPGTRIDQSSGSSDDEVQGFLAANMGTPVKFRTSPPIDVVKPGKSLSPPPKLFHYEVSSRKRHRHMHKPHHLQRPCLDFEKMQQLKARAVTAWRHNGDHSGELSVFCW